MKAHSEQFKEEIKLLGKQQDVRITYTINDEQIVLGSEDINSAIPNYEASLLKSVMKGLDLDSNVDIPLGTEIKFEYGLLINKEYEYLDYGNYIVYKSEKQEDTLSYKITCYDKMLYSMKDYEHIDIPYPTNIYNFLKKLCEKIGLTMKEANFANMTRTVPSELFMTINEDGTYSPMGYTYRDVLDQIAETTGGCICITLDDKVEVRYVNKTIKYETSKKSTNIEFESSVKEIVKIKELDGKSTQDGTPTPDNRVEIENIEGNIEFKVKGKNLLNLLKCSFSGCTLNSDNKSLTCNLNNQYFASIYPSGLNNWLLENKGKTITFSTGTPLESKLTSIIIYGTRSDGSRYQEANKTGTGKCSITIADDFTAITSIELRFNRQGSTFTDTTTVINYAMLELGSTATDYEPYKSQVVTFPLGEEKLMEGSYLADDGIHHRRKQYVITGQENWYEYTASGEYSDDLHCYFGLNDVILNSKMAIKSSICTHFKNPGTWVMVPSVAQYGTYQDNPNVRHRYFITNISTLAEWKKWLSDQYANGTPVIVEYELAEEEIVPYTEAQKTILTSIKTMKGTNIFEFPSDTIISYPINYDTIDEEYINDTNVNFGEKYRAN